MSVVEQQLAADKNDSHNQSDAREDNSGDNDSREDNGTGKQVTLDDALKLAQAHHRNGNLTIAERTYMDILDAVPDHFPTVYHLAALLFQRGDFPAALIYGEKSIVAAPDNAGCWTNYGIILSTNKKHQEASDAFDEALALAPESYEAWSNKSYALFQMDRFEEAEEAAAQATLLDENRPDAYMNLGIALAAQERYDEAIEIWEMMADMTPDDSRIYANWSNTLRQKGHYQDAEIKGKKAVDLDDNNAEAWNNLGNARRGMGQLDDAAKAYRKATNIKPDYGDAHSNMAVTFLDMKRYPEAITAARYALSFEASHKEANNVLAVALLGMGRHEDAYVAAQTASRLKPEEPVHYLNMADALSAMSNYDDAEAVMQQALKLAPDSAEALVRMAEVQQHLDMLDDALATLDKAIALEDETPSLLLQKARIYQHANQVDKALALLDGILALTPDNPVALLTKAEMLLTVNRKDEAKEIVEKARPRAQNIPSFYLSLSSYKKFSLDDPDFIALKAFGDKLEEYSLECQVGIHFTLFKAYEDIGDYDQAFTHLKKANDIKAKQIDFSPDNIGHALVTAQESFTSEFIQSFEGLGCDSDVPVFVCGMPRSGTTLTEQIISAHPDVYGAGELYDINSVVRNDGPLTHDNARIMGEAYLARLRAKDMTGTAKRITDKMPGNINSLGLIKCILPHAKIIVCNRNPMDNLLSCYKQNFAMGHFWSYDLEFAARQYIAYKQMVDYWREVLPEGSFLEIDYEETVNNFEENARILVDYIGLPWNDACLEPHKQKRAVLTASKNQVIRPIYKTSIEAWRRYETQLQPMYEILKAGKLVD